MYTFKSRPCERQQELWGRYGAVSGRYFRTTENKQKEQWRDIAWDAAKVRRKSRKLFENEIAEKRNRLRLLDSYCSAFYGNKIIHPKDLALGSYIARDANPIRRKIIILIVTDQKGTLGLCWSIKYIETYLRNNVTDRYKEKIRDPKRNYLTVYETPLAVLKIIGWSRSPQRNVVVYCNLTLAKDINIPINICNKSWPRKYNKIKPTKETCLSKRVAPRKLYHYLQERMWYRISTSKIWQSYHRGSTHTVVAMDHS